MAKKSIISIAGLAIAAALFVFVAEVRETKVGMHLDTRASIMTDIAEAYPLGLLIKRPETPHGATMSETLPG